MLRREFKSCIYVCTSPFDMFAHSKVSDILVGQPFPKDCCSRACQWTSRNWFLLDAPWTLLRGGPCVGYVVMCGKLPPFRGQRLLICTLWSLWLMMVFVTVLFHRIASPTGGYIGLSPFFRISSAFTEQSHPRWPWLVDFFFLLIFQPSEGSMEFDTQRMMGLPNGLRKLQTILECITKIIKAIYSHWFRGLRCLKMPKDWLQDAFQGSVLFFRTPEKHMDGERFSFNPVPTSVW